MVTPRDRDNISPPGALLERVDPNFPLPPLNVHVNSSFEKGCFDIRWSNPAELQPNTCFNLVGTNIYRAFNQYGPWMRLNTEPIGATYWRDNSQIRLAQENVSNRFTSMGPSGDAGGKYFFRTKHKPIHINPSINDPNCTNINVTVTVNGKLAFVESIQADEGIVEIRHLPTYDVIGKKQINAIVPVEGDTVLATYKYITNEIRSDLDQRLFYRITTVAIDDNGHVIETPLNQATVANRHEVEKLDYIWTEAIRRSKWILDQGGERVKVFLRKSAGTPCGCNSGTRKQPQSDCVGCFGTGFVGGYDGPYDIIVSPDDGDRKISQSNRGRTMEHSYDSWTSNEPLLSQRDFIVKQNGDRYAIGPVRSPSNRGMQLLQFFPMSHLDEQDIRTKVPVLDTRLLIAPQTRYITKGKGNATPMMTEKSTIEDNREVRGKTATYENITY